VALGPVMFNVQGIELTPSERDYLQHPLTGGVILFDQNYETPEQLERLIQEIHSTREPPLLVAVDQEGGRVQRFRNGFTPLPAARVFGQLYDDNRQRAKRLAEACGWLMAAELRAVGVDLSFAPVLDLDRGLSEVIGDRAYHSDPEAVADIARSYMNGMSQAGMAATGKHFPGHGSVPGDSHLVLPADGREYADIYNEDLVAFERMIHYGLAAMMVAHVVYPRVDSQAASFSRLWIQRELRGRLGFQGVVFSDDLSMAGAKTAGNAPERARAALTAGCDMIIVCHDVAATEQILGGLEPQDDPTSHLRLIRMHGQQAPGRTQLAADERHQQAVRMIASIV